MTTRLRYEALAAAWVAAGSRSNAVSLSDWQLLTLICWISSAGARKEGVSEDLKQFVKVSRERVETQRRRWLDDLLAERSYCDRCGERYRVGNLSLCSGCGQTYCYRCAAELPSAANGNAAHFCGGEMVG